MLQLNQTINEITNAALHPLRVFNSKVQQQLNGFQCGTSRVRSTDASYQIHIKWFQPTPLPVTPYRRSSTDLFSRAVVAMAPIHKKEPPKVINRKYKDVVHLRSKTK